MLIEIREIASEGRCRFDSAVGTAMATWMGETSPEIGPAHVEITVPDAVDWASVQFDAADDEAVSQRGDMVALRGTAIDVDELGVLVMRLGDTTTMVDTTGKPAQGVRGRMVELVVPRIELPTRARRLAAVSRTAC